MDPLVVLAILALVTVLTVVFVILAGRVRAALEDERRALLDRPPFCSKPLLPE